MQKLIVILGFVAIISFASAVDCPDEDEDSPATYFPHETECGKFYECHNGDASLLDCAPGTYWDATQNICSSDVDCGDLLTSTAPPPTTGGPPTEPPTEPNTEVPTEPPTESY